VTGRCHIVPITEGANYFLLSTQRLTQRHALILLLAYRLLKSLEKPSDELFTSEESATLYGSN